MSIIDVKNIVKSFGATKVLDNVSFEIKKGEVVSIVGPSGSGKSTLLRTFNCLEGIDSGRIDIEGQILVDIENAVFRSTREQRSILSKVGMVFQHFNLFPHKTVFENVVEAPLILKKMCKKEIEKFAEKLLRKVGLMDKKEAYPSQLSGGQKQRVAIARALGMKPDIILFDEPTSALDPELVGDVQNVILELAKEHMTMVIVSHDMNFVKKISNRIIFMDDGKIIEETTSEKFFNNSTHPRLNAFLEKVNI
jgi:polar amino acid transport system ATP-binding protein